MTIENREKCRRILEAFRETLTRNRDKIYLVETRRGYRAAEIDTVRGKKYGRRKISTPVELANFLWAECVLDWEWDIGATKVVDNRAYIAEHRQELLAIKRSYEEQICAILGHAVTLSVDGSLPRNK